MALRFTIFCNSISVPAWPPRHDAVASFAIELTSTRIAASVDAGLRNLATFSSCCGYTFPASATLRTVQEALHRTVGRAPNRAPPLRLHHLLRLSPSSFPEHVDSTIMLMAHHAMLRGKEVLALRWEHLRVLPSGDVEITIPPAADKTNRSHLARTVLVPTATSPCARSLQALLRVSAPSAHICPHRSHTALTKAIRRMCSAVGMFEKFTPHSLRAGGCTDLLEGGADSEAVRFNGRWASEAYTRYWRPDPAEVAAHLSAAALAQLPVALRHAPQAQLP